MYTCKFMLSLSHSNLWISASCIVYVVAGILISITLPVSKAHYQKATRSHIFPKKTGFYCKSPLYRRLLSLGIWYCIVLGKCYWCFGNVLQDRNRSRAAKQGYRCKERGKGTEAVSGPFQTHFISVARLLCISTITLLFYPEDGSRRFIQNVGNFTPDYTSRPGRL